MAHLSQGCTKCVRVLGNSLLHARLELSSTDERGFLPRQLNNLAAVILSKQAHVSPQIPNGERR